MQDKEKCLKLLECVSDLIGLLETDEMLEISQTIHSLLALCEKYAKKVCQITEDAH